MKEPISIDYYSDVLCVWAWIAQRRIDELNLQWGNKITIVHRYIDVFGDAHHKISTQWQDKGGYQGFSKHVFESAAQYEEASVNQQIWDRTRPTSSANTHLVLKAVEIAYSSEKSVAQALRFRQAFFIDALDISDINVLFSLIEQSGLNVEKVNAVIQNGQAMAALMQDYQQANRLTLKGSPSFILDNGRQILYGNVGYRVLSANVEELIKNNSQEASWC